jgi:hypothetical protein
MGVDAMELTGSEHGTNSIIVSKGIAETDTDFLALGGNACRHKSKHKQNSFHKLPKIFGRKD